MIVIHSLKDERLGCYSLMTEMKISQYIDLVEFAYDKRGGIAGQRERLRTTSAIRIRRRMVDDIGAGTVLPPITLGVIVPRKILRALGDVTKREMSSWIRTFEPDAISIIDGMQRTTAIKEALDREPNIANTPIRVELWLASATNNLIYRMLILNTGQVPWNLRRQVEVVFRSLISEVSKEVDDLEVLYADMQRRRAHGGQFQADDLVELFLAYGSRKEKIDVRERVADEFTRLDFIEATSEIHFTGNFSRVLAMLVALDIRFDRYKDSATGAKARFRHGKDLFASQPAAIGFITAMALEIQGRPGTKRDTTQQQDRLSRVEENFEFLLNRLDSMSDEEIGEFLDLITLNELVEPSSSNVSVGDFEREFFTKGFQTLIDEHFNLDVMTACWRAY